jgi:signal transduction histidine kinase
MDRDSALVKLATGNARERLEGARHLISHATTADTEKVRSALRNESVPWIRSALEEVLAALSSDARPSPRSVQDAPGDTVDDTTALDDVYMRAINENSLRIIHELRPLVGKARLFGEQEFKDFADSKTRRELESLVAALAAVEQLGKAAAAPVLTDVDLGQLVADVVTSCAAQTKVSVDLPAPHSAVVRGDRGLIEMVLRNGISNAIDAVDAATGGTGRVAVNWGVTDREYWVAVLDDGPGLPGPASQLFETGISTKPGHLGMGLATAQLAARSLGGRVTLLTRPAGASFELRVPFQHMA